MRPRHFFRDGDVKTAATASHGVESGRGERKPLDAGILTVGIHGRIYPPEAFSWALVKGPVVLVT